MSSDFYGAQAGEIADEGARPGWDDDDLETPEEIAAAEARAEEPPDWYLEEEAERHARIHRDQDHDGAECDCPVAEPEYSEEAPF